MPGLEKSAPKVARPVTLSSPSGLLVRLPIHLLFEPFAVIAALSLPLRLARAADCLGGGSATLPRCQPSSLEGSLEILAAILQGTGHWTTALAPCPLCRDGAARTCVLHCFSAARRSPVAARWRGSDGELDRPCRPQLQWAVASSAIRSPNLMFDFDRVIERRGTHASKWDMMARLSGIDAPDAIAMWVADMDFAAPPGVTEALAVETRRAI